MYSTKKKKILYVVTKSNWGGAQRYVYDLASSRLKDQFDITVAFGGHDLLEDKLKKKGVKTVSLTWLDRDINVFKDLKAKKEIEKLLTDIEPEILHLNSSKAGYLGALAAKKTGVPKVIFTVHGWPVNEERNMLMARAIEMATKKTVGLSTKTIVVSIHDFEQGKKMFPQDKIVNIPNGIDFEVQLYEREKARKLLFGGLQQIKEKAHVIGTIAELTKNKGLKYALEAIMGLKEKFQRDEAPGFHYVIIGEGEDEQKLRKQIANLQLEDRVTIKGFVDDIHKYFKAFDIFLLPSTKEGLPYVLLEAGRALIPIVATDVGGVQEIVGDIGYIAQPKKPDELANKLAEALKNLRFREDKPSVDRTLELYSRIKKKFNINTMIEKTAALYN